MPLECLLYHSRALVPDTPENNNAILASCSRNNLMVGVTGFLHREQGHFLQYLEGSADALDEVIGRIRRDTRHTDVTVMIRGPIATRQLPDWQMGFVDGSVLSLVDVAGNAAGEIDFSTADPADLMHFVFENADNLSAEAA